MLNGGYDLFVFPKLLYDSCTADKLDKTLKISDLERIYDYVDADTHIAIKEHLKKDHNMTYGFEQPDMRVPWERIWCAERYEYFFDALNIVNVFMFFFGIILQFVAILLAISVKLRPTIDEINQKKRY